MANIIEFMNDVSFDADVVSVQSATPLDDGYCGVLDGLITNENDLYELGQASDVTSDRDFVLVVGADTYINDDDMRIPLHDKSGWTYKENRPVRAYRLRPGMRFKINTSAISGTPTVDQYIVPQDSDFQLAAAADLSGDTTLAFVVEKTGSDCNISTGKSFVEATIMRVYKI